MDERSVDLRWAARQLLVWALVVFGVASLMALTAPSADRPTERIAVALIIGGGAILVATVSDRVWIGTAVGAVSAALGGTLLTDPERFVVTVSRIVAVGVLVGALAVGVVLRRRRFQWWVVLVTAALIAAGGALFVRYDPTLLPLGLGLGGLATTGLIGLGVVRAARTSPTGQLGLGAAVRNSVAAIEAQLAPGGTDPDSVPTWLFSRARTVTRSWSASTRSWGSRR